MNNLIRDYEKHFLFNFLNSIKYFCRVDNEKASELLVVFAGLLDYMIFDERKYVSILEEFKLLSHIKSIQQMRFNNEVILVKEEAEDIEIPKGIILYILLLGYNLNILRRNEARIEIRVNNKSINIKMISDLSLNIEEVRKNEFFKKVYDNVINLDCRLNLYVNENELSFDIFL